MLRKVIVTATVLACAMAAIVPSLVSRQVNVPADWPMYRATAARTAFTTELIPDNLSLKWTYHAMAKPRPAWPYSKRMQFDRVYQPVMADGAVYFGNSVDGGVYALDAETGRVRWRFYTDAPVRFAPAVWKDTVLVVSDDGFLYALDAKDGKLNWKKRGGPNDSSIFGNRRLISKWPARGGPVVVDGVVYFAAGIWPSDGIYLYALDAVTGKTKWVNNDSGDIYMAQPHGGANAKSGVSAQGYLVVSGDHLLVPTGRAVPASFNRHTGKFEYFHLQKYGHKGGAPTMAVGDFFFNSGLSFSSQNGEKQSIVGDGQVAATRDGLVRIYGTRADGYQWVDTEKPDRKGSLVKSKALRPTWTVEGIDAKAASLVVAGDKVIAGCDGHVDLIDSASEKIVWSAKVAGIVHGIALARGKLTVSTDRGRIYCFDSAGTKSPKVVSDEVQESPYGKNEKYVKAAEEIIERTEMTDGYCLDIGCGNGALACELAKRTRLRIFAVDDDPKMVALARKNLAALGMYGKRVTVQQRNLKATGYPRYFANLIVSRKSIDRGAAAIVENKDLLGETRRLQRPFGGVICLGDVGKMEVKSRGELSGAGSWTHQYADPANTLNSGDTLVGGKLGMLWFRDMGLIVPQRHGRAPSPLFSQGRLFHEGLHGIVAVDAYNGHVLWRYKIKGLLDAYNGDELMGVSGTGSNFCLHGDNVYIRDGQRCLRLDATNGTLVGEFNPPAKPDGKPGTWGYIASVDGMLFGTVANEEHIVTYRYRKTTGDMKRQLTESHSLFAIDTASGEMKWHYKAKDSIRHNAIAIGDGKVFLIDRPQALFDRFKRPNSKKHATGRLVAIDAKTGKTLWSVDEDIYGTLLAVSEDHDALLMSYQPTRFRLDSEIGGRMTVFSANDGKHLWQVKAKYESRPMINDRTVYAQGGAWDLLTGEPQPFNFRRSYGCGIFAGCKNMMLFRSATLGYFDLTKNKETTNYGGMRPGCWVNAIPAGGVVLVPDATAGCRCSYLNRTWIALDSQMSDKP